MALAAPVTPHCVMSCSVPEPQKSPGMLLLCTAIVYLVIRTEPVPGDGGTWKSNACSIKRLFWSSFILSALTGNGYPKVFSGPGTEPGASSLQALLLSYGPMPDCSHALISAGILSTSCCASLLLRMRLPKKHVLVLMPALNHAVECVVKISCSIPEQRQGLYTYFCS